MKCYEINGKKYIVNRTKISGNNKLLDNIVYLLIDYNKKLNSKNKGENNGIKSSK